MKCSYLIPECLLTSEKCQYSPIKNISLLLRSTGTLPLKMKKYTPSAPDSTRPFKALTLKDVQWPWIDRVKPYARTHSPFVHLGRCLEIGQLDLGTECFMLGVSTVGTRGSDPRQTFRISTKDAFLYSDFK